MSVFVVNLYDGSLYQSLYITSLWRINLSMTEALKVLHQVCFLPAKLVKRSERMQESFHALLGHNTGPSSIPVRLPRSLSPSPSLSRDLAHLLRIALGLTPVNILRARRSPSSIRPVLTKPKHPQEDHSVHPPSCTLSPPRHHPFIGGSICRVFLFFRPISSSRHRRPLSAPPSLRCSPAKACHAGAGGSASSVRNEHMLTARWAVRKPLLEEKKRKEKKIKSLSCLQSGQWLNPQKLCASALHCDRLDWQNLQKMLHKWSVLLQSRSTEYFTQCSCIFYLDFCSSKSYI